MFHFWSQFHRERQHHRRVPAKAMNGNNGNCGFCRRSNSATVSVLHASALWPSLVHALSPPVWFLISAVLLTCVPIKLLADPVITFPSGTDDCQNASTLGLFAIKRHKRSSLFGRKRQNGHPNGKSTGNHTGPPLHYLEPWPANPNYWIPDRYHENTVCLLASFSGIVRIRPSNSTFRGGTFMVSPEDSLGRRANCERNSRNMFWKFSQSDEREVANEDEDEYDVNLDADDTTSRKAESSVVSLSRGKSGKSSRLVLVERSNRLLSAGFHVVGSVIEFHVAYIECLQQADKNVLNNRYRIYGDGVCVNLSVSFDMGSFGDRFAYECNYIWGKTLKDVHYNQNRRFYAGEVQISLKMVRIDKDPLGSPPYSFRKMRRRCAWDSVLSWQSLTITGSLVVLFIVGFFGLCVCSNSSCHDETHTNWCCLCCGFCRRRRRAAPSRPLMDRSQQRGRLNSNHTGHSNYRSHAPPPPPPPAPPSSMNSSRNQNSCSRKPTFSTTSYSYDGNGSNPTGQSSSAMSTALETDDESSNGYYTPVPGGGQQVLLVTRYLRPTHHSALPPRANGKLKLHAKLLLHFISGQNPNQMEWHLGAPQLAVLLKSHWLTFLPQMPRRPSRLIESGTLWSRSVLYAPDRASSTATTPLTFNPTQLLYFYLLYWQLTCQLALRHHRSLQHPTSRDLCPAKLLPSKSVATLTTSTSYYPTAGFPLLSPNL